MENRQTELGTFARLSGNDVSSVRYMGGMGSAYRWAHAGSWVYR